VAALVSAKVCAVQVLVVLFIPSNLMPGYRDDQRLSSYRQNDNLVFTLIFKLSKLNYNSAPACSPEAFLSLVASGSGSERSRSRRKKFVWLRTSFLQFDDAQLLHDREASPHLQVWQLPSVQRQQGITKLQLSLQHNTACMIHQLLLPYYNTHHFNIYFSR